MDEQIKDRERSDDIEIENRVLTIAKAIIGGYKKRRFLLQHLSEKYNLWNVSERQIDNYIKSAKELIKETQDEQDLAFEFDLALNRLDALFTMNMAIQDFREARGCIMDKVDLLGFKKTKIDMNIEQNDPFIIELSNEDEAD